MKIFVTGAEGFIGSHLVEHLIQKNHNVTSLVQYNSFGNKGWLDNINSAAKKIIIFVLEILGIRNY